MTLHELPQLGIHFIVGLSGPQLTREETKLLSKLQPAGIILFSHNVDIEAKAAWPEKLRKLIAETKEAIGRNSLLVSIDHEGGRVNRLPPPITHFPSACCYRKKAFEVGQAMGRELHALSINLNFAPVLDVLTEGSNTVIGDRAFSSHPEEVAQAGWKFIEGLQTEGVLPCGKHFPGHGGTIADSHFELPVRNITREALEQCEILPFQRLIRADLPLIMTAHVLYPELDSVLPATLSKPILKDLLRSHLKFSGTVISDALEMKALSHLNPREIILRMLEAEVDIFLVAKPEGLLPISSALNLAEEIIHALASGELDSKLLQKSKHQVLKLLKYTESSVFKKTHNQSVLGCREHQALADSLKEIGTAKKP